ncbi:MAG TPA: BadF/BadG/BcrA/BcrD ATPase family protein [Blastocatellia bacterium]|jgi:predicted CoA-substrate-specific enzyme activase|nr:BadF/BadG/BcrA/BcrD ATPase family protein [Blastocatellia bacterium]
MNQNYEKLYIGLDVGSTTVKAVVVDPVKDEILWQDYQRHETKQPEKVLEFLKRIEEEFPIPNSAFRIFITGSGGGGIARLVGAKFVQEVNAVSLAVEKLYPEAGSVIELGGQDAKIIIFKEDPETGKKKKIPSMNDKCAGGTGAVIDKINAKLRIPADKLCDMGYYGLKLHPVAGKCGVFAETDINSLQKMGVQPNELMASLFEAIIGQNLAVLTRGNTLRPHVLLLGGPNTYIRGMVEAWKYNIPKIWEERNTELPQGVDPKDLIKVPQNAQYFAAIGAVEFGKSEDENVGVYRGFADLDHYINFGRLEEKKKAGGKGLSNGPDELDAFKKRYKGKKFVPATFHPDQVVEGFIGLDGGSTSTKAVLLDRDRNVLVKTYQLSKGNPIEDTKEVFAKLEKQITDQGATLKVMGVGTTGYAKDILKDTLGADVALVETVAHTESALQFYKDVDVIVDVGGQDIKLIILKNRQVKDFKLNTQCSAGNGYFLQSTAEGFGMKVEDYADIAFGAQAMPTFGYGCAVFMQSDIVDFQRQGWKPEEIMAGLAAVLPKNIWLYVSQIPNIAALGSNFVLQGGTQHNLAAVKAQVDFIESRFKGKDQPRITVHEHCGESGAIGAAIEAIRLWDNGRQTSFIGLDNVERISYDTHRNENTRCFFCKNKCLRTFIDVKVSGAPNELEEQEQPRKSKIPILPGVKRLIVGNSCERGLVEDVNDMRVIKKGMDAAKAANPNFVELGAKAVWRSFNPPKVADPAHKIALTGAQRQRNELLKNREKMRIGIPRVLNQYSVNPLFSAYFESLGVPPQNLIYSDYTTEQLYKDGAKRGAIDPCFPSKIGIPHVHNLIYVHHKKKPLDLIFFPMIDALPSELVNTQSNRACPTVTATPEAVKAAFTKEGDLFAQNGIRYLDPLLNLDQPRFLEKQMFEAFKDILGLTREENTRAIEEGYKALDIFYNVILRGQAREVLNQLEAEDRLGVVLLARPYHNDPGLNHEILEEFQKLGYPVFTMDSLPMDDDILWRLFGDEVRAGVIKHPLDVQDAWKNSYSENTSRKVWAAKYTARHPNLVALELSSFKCGHDAPIYTVVEEVVQNSGTPYFCFKDIDENKPSGSIKIRVETIGYFLKRYREDMIRNRDKVKTLEERLAEYERMLRLQLELEARAQDPGDHGRSLPVLPGNHPAGQYAGMAAD